MHEYYHDGQTIVSLMEASPHIGYIGPDNYCPPASTWILTSVNTPPSEQRQGKARALLQQVLQDADADGVTLLLEVAPDDPDDYAWLRAWYERLGFAPLDNECTAMERRPRVTVTT